MKRLGAVILPLLALLVCSAPACAAAKSKAATPAKPHLAKSQSAKSQTAKATKLAKSQQSASKPTPVPLPDRNPMRSAAAAANQTSSLASTGDAETTGALPANPNAAVPQAKSPLGPANGPQTVPGAQISLPDRNPKLALASPAANAVQPDAMPLPDPKPGRPTSAPPLVLKAPAPVASSSFPSQMPGLDFAAILKPLLDYDLSSADTANLKEAFRLTFKGDTDGADALVAKIKDPAARKLATWYEFRSANTDVAADRIEQFRLANPEWPDQNALRDRAETALFLDGSSPDKVKAFFSSSAPLTGAGKAALAGAYLKDGNQAGAKELVTSAWRDYQLNPPVEKKILSEFGSMLTLDDHRARVDRLLYPDNPSLTDAALRVAKLLPAEEQKKIAARIAVVKRGSNAGKLLDAIPASATAGDVGLLFNRIQWLRRKDRDQEAWNMLLSAPTSPDQLLDLDGWWTERRVNCRAALNAGQPRIAYQIAVEHGPITGDSYVEAEFLAGWIALRFLSDPKSALEHFQALRTAAKSSKNIALAEYWLGRSALALGDPGAAMIHFHGAAKYPQFFFGQLGRQALDARPAMLEVTPTPLPTEADAERFLNRDAVRAIGVALAADMQQVTPQFFLELSRDLDSPAEVVLLAEFARLSGNPQISLRLSKIAFNRDIPVGDYALPIGVLPQIKSLTSSRVDPALMHALSRQESEFNASAKSPVGASGLMQLMPGTARAIAKEYKVKYEASALTNPAYNVQLGEAHLSDLIDSYSGSYFLALAAYNAGPGRVQEWIKAFGDPRDPDVDPIDWIERIPFTETREYVLKIMETVQLYRARLSGPENALQLVQDLNRGRATRSQASAAIEVQAKSE